MNVEKDIDEHAQAIWESFGEFTHNEDLHKQIIDEDLIIGDYYLTVGQLKKDIEHLPDSAKVYYQRIEDSYFTPEGGWGNMSKFMPSSDYPDGKDEYIRCWSRVAYKDDDNLYLTAHY